MKHSEYFKQKQENKEFQEAEEELKIHFAFAKAVVKGRIVKGLSQAELARRVHTKQANISRIESGLANPTLKLIQKLVKVLDIKVQFGESVDARPIVVSFKFQEIYTSIPAADWPNPTNWRHGSNLYTKNEGYLH